MPSKLPSVVVYLRSDILETVKARAAADQRSVSKWLSLEIERLLTIPRREPHAVPGVPPP